MRSTYAVVHLSALDANIRLAKEKLNPATKLLAVIKANAYGHGIVPVGTYLDSNDDVAAFGVALCEEGVALREAGVQKPILILGTTDAEHMADVVRFDLMPTVYSAVHVIALEQEAERQNKPVCAHLKIDTGMRRIGVMDLDALQAVLDAFDASPSVLLAGVFTHFAKSESDASFTQLQAQRFEQALSALRARGFSPVVHAANSGAILDFPQYQYDMVRLGISLYGCHPDGNRTAMSGLTPALSLVSHISNLKTLPAGEGVSYGLRYVTTRETRVATIPIGYGDGYKRCLTNKADVLVHGRRCKQIGTICMDQCMIDVTDVPYVQLGDAVLLIGSVGAQSITADELADKAETISYEILLSISERVPRVYEV